MVVGRTGKRLKTDKHNKVKKHHISAFLELVCKQLPLHLPPAPTISQGVAQCPSVESPPPSHVMLGSWRSYIRQCKKFSVMCKELSEREGVGIRGLGVLSCHLL